MLKISIITVCLNSAETIERTIKSVLNQKYKNIEFILVDGGSKDGTLEILKKYKKNISKLIGTKDESLYDAMNKGFSVSSGDVLFFLNSDDALSNSLVVTKIMNEFRLFPKTDFVCGHVLMRYPNFTRKTDSRYSALNLKFGFLPSQQATFYHRRCFAKRNLDIKYSLAADFEFLCYLHKNKFKGKNIDLQIASCLSGGASSNKEKMDLEKFEIIEKYFGKTQAKNFERRRNLEDNVKKVFKKTGVLNFYRKNVFSKNVGSKLRNLFR